MSSHMVSDKVYHLTKRRLSKGFVELTHSYFGNGVTFVCRFTFLSDTDCRSSHKDASSFWLNEGWTTYFERVLQQVIHGSAARDFSCIIGAKALADALKEYEDRPKYQRLVIDFDYGEVSKQLALISILTLSRILMVSKTDVRSISLSLFVDAYSSIPYEKGAAFLLYLGAFSPSVQDVP